LSPSPEQVEYAEMLLRRANGDLYACRALAGDAAVDDGVIGFHAQQAVEKALKVGLVVNDVELPRTHDLQFIVGLLRQAGVSLPEAFPDIAWLTPWAAEWRYDEPYALDRAASLSLADLTVVWAARLLDEVGAG
jgi:HEPN domain-containing protein